MEISSEAIQLFTEMMKAATEDLQNIKKQQAMTMDKWFSVTVFVVGRGLMVEWYYGEWSPRVVFLWPSAQGLEWRGFPKSKLRPYN